MGDGLAIGGIVSDALNMEYGGRIFRLREWSFSSTPASFMRRHEGWVGNMIRSCSTNNADNYQTELYHLFYFVWADSN